MRFYIANFLALRLAYSAPMELQTQIDELKASSKRQKIAIISLTGVIVAGVGIAAIQPAGDAEFDTITCKSWKVVDNARNDHARKRNDCNFLSLRTCLQFIDLCL